MTKVTFKVATGWGLDVRTFKFNNNKDMMKFVDLFVAKYHKQNKGFMGSTIYVESAKMTYESGKTFTKKFD